MTPINQRAAAVHERKTTPLTPAQLETTGIKRPIQLALARAIGQEPADRSAFKILDLGCGRGATVARLRRDGWAADGAEIDPAQQALAQETMALNGLDHAKIYRIDSFGTVDCPDAQYDFLFSDNVVEHVADIDSFVKETARLLKPNGVSFHLFPSRWHLVEVHVRQPLVHWLPKGSIQRALVHLCVGLNIHAHWANLPQSHRERVNAYAGYLMQSTHYRSPTALRSAFLQRYVSVDTILTNAIIAEKLGRLPLSRPLAGLLGKASIYIKTTALWAAK